MDDVGLRTLDRSCARELWTMLDQRRRPALAASWPWTDTWLDHYADTVEHELVAAERAGEPVAVALLTRGRVKRRGLPVRQAHVGTAGEPVPDAVFVERNALHAVAEDLDAVAAALIDRVADTGGWDELHLDAFVPEHADALARAHGRLQLDRRPSPMTDLAAIRERGGDVLAALRSGPRQRLRKTLRAFGDLDVEWASTDAEAEDVLTELAALHQRRWTQAGKPGAFSSERFTAFHHAAVRRLRPGCGAVVVRVRAAGSRTVGCLLCYVDGDRVLFYQSGFGSFESKAERPGHATHLLVMQACLERGYAAYEFLPGEGRYKDELSTGTDELVWGFAPARHARARILTAAAAARRLF